MAVQHRTALILYGSETGNAQDMAEELGRLCQRLHFANRVAALDAVDLVRLKSLSSHGPHEILVTDAQYSECPLTA